MDTSKWLGNDLIKLPKDDSQDEKPKTFEKINPNLTSFPDDYMYHLNLKHSHSEPSKLKKEFGDVRFVCMGGTPHRMLQFANYIKDVIGYKLPMGHQLENITASTDRYTMYKVGPVLAVNHGMGCPSISILLNEILKLLYYAECKDVTIFRMGTSGGIGLKPGTLVITEEAVDGMFRSEYRQIILGKEVSRPTKLDKQLIQELLDIGSKDVTLAENIVTGKTLCAHDFYEGQGRIDGIYCDYGINDKLNFLLRCKEANVKNIEMESLAFASFLHHAHIRAAIVCVTLVDRLNGDQLEITHEQNLEFQERPFKLVGDYIKRYMNF